MSDFPWADRKWNLLWRNITGQLVFLLLNLTLILLPLTFTMIIFQTGTFWTSILAFFCFKETILPFEIVSMVICFAGMVTITIPGSKNEEDT